MEVIRYNMKMRIRNFGRFLVALLMLIFVQSSLGANAALKDFSNVTTKDLSQNGYYKLPDGMMLQWGIKSGTSTGAHTVYLNMAFSLAGYSVICTPIPKSGTQGAAISVFVDGIYTTYFRASVNFARDGSSGAAGESFYWFAVGRWK